jgi:PTH1 family peptidyl-tRNA hydrolase
MAWIIAGLGNPGEEYDMTRHNAGRMALDYFARNLKFTPWREDKRAKARVASGLVDRTVIALVAPDTFMNKSGSAIAKFIKSQKAAERLIVVHDDFDLPLGAMKLSYDRGSGGHKGLESIMRAVKTKKFTRVRIGISPSTASGAIRKPEGEKVINNFILTKFKVHELAEIKQIFKRVAHALETIVLEGPQAAMNRFNADV